MLEDQQNTMLPGPTLVVIPTACSSPLKITTLASGNTFGAVFWTDGKCEAPMLEDEPWLRKHPDDNRLFWTGEWKKIATLDYDTNFGPGKQWTDLPYAETPTEDDYFEALESGIAGTDEKMRHIRTRLWWAGNDPIRESGMGTLPPPHIRNLASLALLLAEDDPQQRLMKAELFRELGFFDDALRLLEWEFPEELHEASAYLAGLAGRKDLRVARFPW